MARNKLSAAEVAAFKKDPVKYAGKHFDGGGLYIEVTEAGGLYWRYKYRLAGKERKFAIGTFDDYSLAEARVEHDKARKLVLAGDHPVDARRTVKIEKEVAREGRRSFRDVAKEYFETKIVPTAAPSTRRRADISIRKMNEGFGDKAIGDVRIADLASVLKKIQAEGKYESRLRAQLTAIKVMGFAIGSGYCETNPFLGVQFTDTFISNTTNHQLRPALTDPVAFGTLLCDIDRDPDEHETSRIALRLLALTAVRPGELAKMAWHNVDLAARRMTVPADLLKSRTQRKNARDQRAGKSLEVPLSRQAVAQLRALHKLTGGGSHLFPARYSRVWKNPHIRTATINSALLRMGYGNTHCAHGFRSSFSTLMNKERMTIEGKQVLRWPEQAALIEVQLDHNDASTKAIYDRGGRWEERCELMQLWADRIDEMRGTPKLRLVA